MLAADYTRDSRTNAAEVLVAAQPPGNTLNIGPAFGPRFICGRYCNYAQFNQPAITWAGRAGAGGSLSQPELATRSRTYCLS